MRQATARTLFVRPNLVHRLVRPAPDRPSQVCAVAESHLPGDIVHAHLRRLEILDRQLAPDIVDDRAIACIFGRKAAAKRSLLQAELLAVALCRPPVYDRQRAELYPLLPEIHSHI